MKKIGKAIGYVERKPGTVAMMGCAGVIFFSMVDVGQILLYISIGIGVIGFLIYSDRKAVKIKRTKKSSREGKDYIL